jgi:hypothetical protein
MSSPFREKVLAWVAGFAPAYGVINSQAFSRFGCLAKNSATKAKAPDLLNPGRCNS